MIFDDHNLNKRVVLLGEGTVAVGYGTCPPLGVMLTFQECPAHETGASVDPAVVDPTRVQVVIPSEAELDVLQKALDALRDLLPKRVSAPTQSYLGDDELIRAREGCCCDAEREEPGCGASYHRLKGSDA